MLTFLALFESKEALAITWSRTGADVWNGSYCWQELVDHNKSLVSSHSGC